MMPYDLPYGGEDKPGGVSPRPEAQDTDKAAKEAMARKGDDAPKIPRAIQDIVDEINAVRKRLSEIWVERYGSAQSRRGSSRMTAVDTDMYPAYDTEELALRAENDKLWERERQLLAEFEEVKAAARIGPGGTINPDTKAEGA